MRDNPFAPPAVAVDEVPAKFECPCCQANSRFLRHHLAMRPRTCTDCGVRLSLFRPGMMQYSSAVLCLMMTSAIACGFVYARPHVVEVALVAAIIVSSLDYLIDRTFGRLRVV